MNPLSWHLFANGKFKIKLENAKAQAICKAVNNTYHKGIDPEAVPDMKEALKKQNDWLQRLWNCSPEQRNKMINDDLNYVFGVNAEALKKAGVPINEKTE